MTDSGGGEPLGGRTGPLVAGLCEAGPVRSATTARPPGVEDPGYKGTSDRALGITPGIQLEPLVFKAAAFRSMMHGRPLPVTTEVEQ